MTAARQLTTAAVAVLLVLSAVATPVLAGGDGGLVDTAGETLDGDGVVDEGAETVSGTAETAGGTTDSDDSTTDETDLGGASDGIDTTTTSATSSSTGSTTSSNTTNSSAGEPVDSSASRHDWPTVGADPAHTGVNTDTTGPRVTLGSKWVAGPTDISGTAVVANDTLYAVSENGTVVALARNGTELWATNVTVGQLGETLAVAGSPSVDGETVYVTGTGTSAGYVVGLDATTGSQQFSLQVGASTRASPVATDGVAYVGSAQSGNQLTGFTGPLTAVNANGTQQWQSTALDSEVAAAPAVTESSVYAVTTAGTLYMVNRSTGEVVDQVGLTSAAALAAPTVANGSVYVAANDSTVYAASTTDLSQTRASASFGGSILGSPVVSDAGVYTATTEGTVARLNTSLATRATTTVDEGVTAPLSMADGTLYVPTTGTVRTLDVNLTRIDELTTPASAGGAVMPSAGVGYVGTDAGVFAVHELCAPAAIGAATVHVPDDCSTIDSALSAVASGGTVVVDSGTYDESVTLSKPVTLRGEAATLNSSYAEQVGIVVAADDVTVDGFAIEQYFTSVRVGAVENVRLRNLTTRQSLDDVLVRPTGGRAVNLSVVESDLDALGSPLVLNATRGGTVDDVTVADSTLRSDSSLPTVEALAASGGSVTDVTVRDVTARESTAVSVEAGSDGHVANVTVGDLTLDSSSRVAAPGIRFVAAPTTGAATVENVSVANADLRGPYRTAVGVEATTADGSGPAVVDGVSVRNTTLSPRGGTTGLALRTGGDASTATPAVRNASVTDTRINGTTTGIVVDNGSVGSVGPVTVTDSAVVDNTVGLHVVAGDASDVSLSNSTVAGNSDFGVEHEGVGLLDATYNDWGDVSGPFDAADPDTDAAAENPDGTGDAVTDNVTYRPWVSPPAAAIETNATNATVNVSEVVGFESGSTDGFGDIESVEWAFGDSTNVTGEQVSHAYDANGTYTVTLTVTDSLGATDTATVELDVVEPEGDGTNETDDSDGTNETDDTATPTPTPTPDDGTATPTPTPDNDTATPTPSPDEGTATPTPTPDEDDTTGGTTAPSGGSSGGSTGGSAASTPTPTPSRTDTVLFTDGSVSSIVFDQPIAGDVSTTDLDELPDGMSEPTGPMLGATRITVPASAEEMPATIRFSVSVERLEASGVAAESVQLARYDGGWETLDTTMVSQTDERVVYEARTPGFSVFAAVAQSTTTASPTATPTATATASPTVTAPATDTPVATTTPTATEAGQLAGDERRQDGPGMQTLLGLGGLLAAIVLIGVVRLRRHGDDDGEPAVRT